MLKTSLTWNHYTGKKTSLYWDGHPGLYIEPGPWLVSAPLWVHRYAAHGEPVHPARTDSNGWPDRGLHTQHSHPTRITRNSRHYRTPKSTEYHRFNFLNDSAISISDGGNASQCSAENMTVSIIWELRLIKDWFKIFFLACDFIRSRRETEHTCSALWKLPGSHEILSGSFNSLWPNEAIHQKRNSQQINSDVRVTILQKYCQ